MFKIDVATVAIQVMSDEICVTSFVALKGVSRYDLFTALRQALFLPVLQPLLLLFSCYAIGLFVQLSL